MWMPYGQTADWQEVAQSLPLDPLAPGAAESLAADVEYRIHLVLQEAKKFMVAGRRSTLLPEDVEYAMDALRVEVSVDVHPFARPFIISPRRRFTFSQSPYQPGPFAHDYILGCSRASASQVTSH